MRWTGAVLCGGASTRMGRDKALLEVGGTPLAVRVAGALRDAGAAAVLAIGGHATALRALGLETVPDDEPGEGPLGGILTALARSADDVVAVLSCDLPGAASTSIAAVVDALAGAPGAAAAWPEHGGPQVLHAAWRSSVAGPPLQAAFAAGARSPRRAASVLPHVVVHGLPGSSLRDVDSPEDLRAARRAVPDARSRRHDGPMPDPTPIPEVDVATLAEAHARGAFVLDVRQPDEYEAGHVPGAVLVPLDQLPARLHEVPRDEHVYVICKSGGRSAAAVEALTAEGRQATNVAGGTMGWIESGHPTASGPAAGER